jgi:parallel beta-helix repeat protein
VGIYMQMRSLLALSLFVAVGCDGQDTSPEADLNIFYVAPTDGGEWDDPEAAKSYRAFTTIQDAIDAATSGDTVAVPTGVYAEDIYMADGVNVVGAGTGETIIAGYVTFFQVGAGTDLSRVSVVNPGTLFTQTGIDIYDSYGSITEVEALYWENGVLLELATDVSIVDSEIALNTYGVWSDDSTNTTIANNLFRGNSVAGITNYTSTGNIIHNTFVGNAYGGSSQLDFGGAIQTGASSEQIANNLLVNNYYGINCESCSNSFSHNLVWGNTTNYTNEATAGGSDINLDPLFTDPGENDYTLQGSSPAIDAGTSLYTTGTDILGTSRPQGAEVDVGMYEFATSAYSLLITEVMSNATVESVGEFVEIYNAGNSAVDLAGLYVTDGDDTDVLVAFGSSVTTVEAGEYAVIVDPDYDGTYGIDSAVTQLTTTDSTVGNGLTTSDKITLYEADGSTIAATFSFPKDPGDGTSMEMYDLANGDVGGNWRPSVCGSESSPGAGNCFPPSGDQSGLVITEVMANAANESSGEYVELFNPTALEIDAAGLVLEDGGGNLDVIQAFTGNSTMVAPGSHALIVDAQYDFDYSLPTDVLLLTTGDSQIGNAIGNSGDTITLYESDGTTPVDSFTHPMTASDGESVEKIDYASGDTAGNWQLAGDSCSREHSPGRLNCAAGGIGTQLFINEVMSNALDEDTGEFIELFNGGADVDLAGLLISDNSTTDTLQAYNGGSTVLGYGQFAVIVDAEYAGEHSIPSGTIVVTTTDTTLGNGLSVSDTVTLWEGDFLIDSYQFPFNAGNGVSVERVYQVGLFDADDNWLASSCPQGQSAGGPNCQSGGAGTIPAYSDIEIAITEVMANALDEDQGEFVELYNYGTEAIDLKTFVLSDGDVIDTIFGFFDMDDTILYPGQYAVILDYEYDYITDDYDLYFSSALMLVTDDTTVGNGLSTTDDIFLFETNGLTLISSYTHPVDPGNGISRERSSATAADDSGEWAASTCSSGSSPGAGNCP